MKFVKMKILKLKKLGHDGIKKKSPGILPIYRDLIGKFIPKWLAVGHGMAALIGFLFLIIFIFLHDHSLT